MFDRLEIYPTIEMDKRTYRTVSHIASLSSEETLWALCQTARVWASVVPSWRVLPAKEEHRLVSVSPPTFQTHLGQHD